MKRPGGGLGSVLGKIGKKPKLSTLVWFDTLFSISLVKTYFSQKWSACYRCLRCFSYAVTKAYVMICRKSQNWTGILSKRKKELRTNSKLATGMGKGCVHGSFKCEFYKFISPNQEQLQKMELYVLWQESNLWVPVDHRCAVLIKQQTKGSEVLIFVC
jgi:hypothetical protein